MNRGLPRNIGSNAGLGLACTRDMNTSANIIGDSAKGPQQVFVPFSKEIQYPLVAESHPVCQM